MKIYIVTSGEYSDYSIRAVFDNKKDAKLYCNKFCDQGDVEIFETNKIGARLKSHSVFRISLDYESGDLIKCEKALIDPSENVSFCVYLNYSDNNRVSFNSLIFTDTKDRAIKIAAEKRFQFKATKDVLIRANIIQHQKDIKDKKNTTVNHCLYEFFDNKEQIAEFGYHLWGSNIDLIW